MVDYSHSSHLLASRLLETSLEAGVLAFHNNVNYSCGTAPDLNRLRTLGPAIRGIGRLKRYILICLNKAYHKQSHLTMVEIA